MSVYTTKRFLALVALSVMVASAAAIAVSFSLTHIFPETKAYHQFAEFSPDSWVKLNHTLVIMGNTVDSYLVATAVKEPPSPANVTIQIFWAGPADRYKQPLVIGGDQVWWTGQHALSQGESVTLHTLLRLPSEGTYGIGGLALSDAPCGQVGAKTVFYLEVQFGIVVSVSDRLSATGENELIIRPNC